MAADLGCKVTDLLEDETLKERIDLNKYVANGVGMPTLMDILDELAKPGRDPRKGFERFEFAEGIDRPEDLQPGMRLPGVVTNVTAFGAFVDIGVHQDGLVHVSQLADSFVKDPHKVVKVGQKVIATVLDVDLQRKRISLSMRGKRDPTNKSFKKAKAHPDKRQKTQTLKKKGPNPFNNPFNRIFNK